MPPNIRVVRPVRAEEIFLDGPFGRKRVDQLEVEDVDYVETNFGVYTKSLSLEQGHALWAALMHHRDQLIVTLDFGLPSGEEPATG